MSRTAYEEIVKYSMDKQVQERSIAYLAEHLSHFMRKQERVLLCFLEHKEGNLSWLMEQALLRCEAVPVVWKGDRKWMSLLKLAFSSKASAIIGPPLILLGLTKLVKANKTPLYIRRVITAGYPCPDWMVDGLVKGFDCEVGGCFGLGTSGAVAGFACGRSWGVHIRDDEYGIQIVDENGEVLPDGEMGQIVLYPKAFPEMRYTFGEQARLERIPCECGCDAPRLMDIQPRKDYDPDLIKLGQQLQSWTSILDCSLKKGPCGLEIEIVCFQGEKLPKLPSCAKRNIRAWDPKNDEPFPYDPVLKKSVLFDGK